MGRWDPSWRPPRDHRRLYSLGRRSPDRCRRVHRQRHLRSDGPWLLRIRAVFNMARNISNARLAAPCSDHCSAVCTSAEAGVAGHVRGRPVSPAAIGGAWRAYAGCPRQYRPEPQKALSRNYLDAEEMERWVPYWTRTTGNPLVSVAALRLLSLTGAPIGSAQPAMGRDQRIVGRRRERAARRLQGRAAHHLGRAGGGEARRGVAPHGRQRGTPVPPRPHVPAAQ